MEGTFIESIEMLDPSKSYSYADYLKWKFQGHVELIRGKVFKMSPAPSLNHQKISGQLLRFFLNFMDQCPCEVFHAPFDVRLFPQVDDSLATTVVQPDICLICDPSKLDARGCNGAPELIIEILSPSTSKKDAGEKFQLYQEAKVKEYWMVIPDTKMVQVFDLTDGQYQLRKNYVEDETIQVGILPQLSVDLSRVFS